MKEFFENDQKYVNIGKIGKLGDHNQIGIFYGANEETIEKIFQSCLNKAQEELKKELDEKSGFLDEMERLIAEKMQEILFRVDLSTACSSTVINDTLQKNIGKLEGEIGKWISAILQEIKSSDDKLATIQAELRKASTALAENIIVLNKIYEYIPSLNAHQSEIEAVVKKIDSKAERTYATILDLGGRLTVFNEKMPDIINQIACSIKDGIVDEIQETFERFKQVAIKESIIDSANKSYNQIERARYREEDSIECAQKKIQNILNAKKDFDDIKQALATFNTELRSHIDNIMRVEITAESNLHTLQDLIHELRLYVQSPLVENGDCPRCDSVKSRVYECKVCGFRKKGISPEEKANWLPYEGDEAFVPPEQDGGVLRARAKETENGKLDIETFCDYWEEEERRWIKKIIFNKNVKHIVLNKKQNIRDLFPNLEVVSFLGTGEITLGSNLFKDCKDKIKFFGLKNRYQTVKLGQFCFTGWTDDEEHADFLVDTFGNAEIGKENKNQGKGAWRKSNENEK